MEGVIMNDFCRTVKMCVEIQENGIIRNLKGHLIGRLTKEDLFSSDHLKTENSPCDVGVVEPKSKALKRTK